MIDSGRETATPVAIVVDPDYGDRIIHLESEMPVWAVKSPVNSAAWDPKTSRHSNSALFSVGNTAARAENLTGVLVDIDEHFGPDSNPQHPYLGIYVVGVALSPALEQRLQSAGFRNFRQARDGFEADLLR